MPSNLIYLFVVVMPPSSILFSAWRDPSAFHFFFSMFCFAHSNESVMLLNCLCLCFAFAYGPLCACIFWMLECGSRFTRIHTRTHIAHQNLRILSHNATGYRPWLLDTPSIHAKSYAVVSVRVRVLVRSFVRWGNCFFFASSSSSSTSSSYSCFVACDKNKIMWVVGWCE